MNYEKLIPSRNTRLKILGLTDFVPDKVMIKIQYWLKTGRLLNLNDPKRYNEKLQWYKLYYHDPLMTECADKFRVREYVSSKGLDDILVPLYGVYNDSQEIEFNTLPNKFVFKTNNGSHTNILCKDKSKLNFQDTKLVLNSWLNQRTPRAGREWAYYDIEPKIICEKYLETSNDELIDYKFYCFNGKPSYIKVAKEHKVEGLQNGIFNMAFEQLPYCRKEVGIINEKIEIPKNFDLMCKVVTKLSEDFPHVRVDLYNIDGEIFFGELTFYDTSGYQIFEPDEFDFILGELFTLEKMIF
ncbi:carbonic anhydrase [Sporosarcina sp. P26b]|uniref:ATP-grasp fold amidoligase family protein n=1 Tax=Sporosarcina sp. P26b TaxID=2048253 RepID=UPI000C162ED4|nr:ATP-grasp fold amidoligase family protein [Sporosarcina sp. P26b]PIC95681.1 carbonic anhydrase [Sporosarcina sp. P26b]